jgi:hypothetical protein
MLIIVETKGINSSLQESNVEVACVPDLHIIDELVSDTKRAWGAEEGHSSRLGTMLPHNLNGIKSKVMRTAQCEFVNYIPPSVTLAFLSAAMTWPKMLRLLQAHQYS